MVAIDVESPNPLQSTGAKTYAPIEEIVFLAKVFS
jgi:hypothetical protein